MEFALLEARRSPRIAKSLPKIFEGCVDIKVSYWVLKISTKQLAGLQLTFFTNTHENNNDNFIFLCAKWLLHIQKM